MKNIDSSMHVRGESIYVNDIPVQEGTLYGAVFGSPRAHGRIRRLDLAAALACPGVERILTAPCPHCEGSGRRQSPETVILAVYREMARQGERLRGCQIRLTLHTELKAALLNETREGVNQLARVLVALLGAEVVIDFSNAHAVANIVAQAVRHKVPLVSGTTGLDAANQEILNKAAQQIPVLWAPNTSLGVQVLAELVEQALRRLGSDFDAEIVEIHHRKKADSPSGTAKRLADAVRAVRPEMNELHGRDGLVGARTNDEVAVLGVRGGDVVGDHTVYLLGTGERIELTHRASSREMLASGALRAARYIVKQKPGKLYRIADVLG